MLHIRFSIIFVRGWAGLPVILLRANSGAFPQVYNTFSVKLQSPALLSLLLSYDIDNCS